MLDIMYYAAGVATGAFLVGGSIYFYIRLKSLNK